MRMGTFFGFTFAMAFVFSLLAVYLVQEIHTNAIGFIAITSIFASIAAALQQQSSSDAQMNGTSLSATKN